MVRKLRPVVPIGSATEGDPTIVVDRHFPQGATRKSSPIKGGVVGDEEWIKRHSPQPAAVRPTGGLGDSVSKQQNKSDSDHSIEQAREVHTHEDRRTSANSRQGYGIDSRQDMNEDNTVATTGGDTAGRQQENVREEVRDHFYSSSAYIDSQNNKQLSMQYENISRRLSATRSTPTTSSRRISRSLSPKKRTNPSNEVTARRHSSLSPRRRKARSSSRSPRQKSKNVSRASGKGDDTDRFGAKSPQRTVKAAVSDRDFQRATSRNEVVDSESSDEALEFTKERYKRRKSRSTNRPDEAPVTRPKKQPAKATSPRRKVTINAPSSDDTASYQKRYDPSSSDYESSTTGASFTEAEKLRLKRQMKRRAVLKRKVVEASRGKNDPMSFMNSALATVASDFVTGIVGQLGLAQPFVFPTSPLVGESDLNDEYNLLRWEDEEPSYKKSQKKTQYKTSFADFLSWDGGQNVKMDDSSQQESSDDASEETQRLSKNGSMEVIATSREKTLKNDPVKPRPSSPQNKVSTITATKGSGPVVLDEKEISKIARSMAKLQGDSMTSEEGDVSGHSFTGSKEGGKDQSIERTNKLPVEKESHSSNSMNVAASQGGVHINLAVSSDSSEEFRQPKGGSFDGGDDDINSLTYSLEEETKTPASPPLSEKEEKEDSSVAKLVSKFEKELPMRRPKLTFLPKRQLGHQDDVNVLAIALSLSADDSLLPSVGKDEVLYPNIKVPSSPPMKDRAQRTFTANSSVPINHIDELKTKIKVLKQRRGDSDVRCHIDDKGEVSTLISEAASVGGEPEFVPHAMDETRTFPEARTPVATKNMLSSKTQTDDMSRSLTLRQPTCLKINLGNELEKMTASLLGHASLGEETICSQQSHAPHPVDIDEMVSKIDGVVQRLIVSGKLENMAFNEGSMLEQRTLRDNTYELLRNLALLKSRRNPAAKTETQTLLATPPQMVVVQPVQQVRKIPTVSSLPIAATPSMPKKEPVNSVQDKPIKSTEATHTTDNSRPMSNMARIRARRDEAAMRIKEKTLMLSGLRAQGQRTGPIPISTSDMLRLSSQIGGTERGSGELPESRHPIDLTHIDERKYGSKEAASTSALTKSRGPPRPEDILVFRQNVDKARIRNSLATPSKTPIHTRMSASGNYSVAMTTSDVDMEEWERTELEKLPILLTKTKSEEQGETRFSMINYDSTHRRTKAQNRESALRQTLREDNSMIDDYEDTDDEDTDDTDSSGGTFGSESDSERLERIASMIQELRNRRQRKR